MEAISKFDEDWFWRCGRLEEAGGSGEQLFTGRLGRMSRAQYSMPAYRSSRPQGPGGGTSFYLSHTVVRRVRRGPAPGIPRAGDAPAGRAYIYPDKAMSRAEAGERQRRLDRQGGGGRRLPAGMCGQVKAMGGVYDRARRCWHVPAEMVSKRVVPPGWRGRAAASSWHARRIGRPDSAPGTPARFQAYIERAEASESGRRAEVESDGIGEISFGTIGSTSEERIQFWKDAEARERPGGRVQYRIIAELPYWLSADDRRRIAERFCEVFTRLDLPHHGVVHLPDVDEGSDDRNVHLHVVYSDRPVSRHPPGGSQPTRGSARNARASPGADGSAAAKAGGGASGSRGRAPLKRPEVAHVGWPGSLRRHFARVVNESIAEAATRGIEPPAGRGFYDPRTYREMGVEKLPAQHMGAWRMRLERAGVPTLRGVRNGWKEGAWRVVEAADTDCADARKVEGLVSRLDDAMAVYPGSAAVVWLQERVINALDGPGGTRSPLVIGAVRSDFEVARARDRSGWVDRALARSVLPDGRPNGAKSAFSNALRLRRRLQEIQSEATVIAGPQLRERRLEEIERRQRAVAQLEELVNLVLASEAMRKCLAERAKAVRHLDPNAASKRALETEEGTPHTRLDKARKESLARKLEELTTARRAVTTAVSRLVHVERRARRAMERPLPGATSAEGAVKEILKLVESGLGVTLSVSGPQGFPSMTWLKMELPLIAREAAELDGPRHGLKDPDTAHPMARRLTLRKLERLPAIDEHWMAVEHHRAVCIGEFMRWIAARTSLDQELRSGLPRDSDWAVDKAWRVREAQLLNEVKDLGSAALRRDAGRTLDGSLTLAAERQQSRDAIRRDLELVDTIISLKRARAANGTSQGGDPRSGTAPRVIDASKGTAQPKAATSRPQPPGPPPIAPRQSRKHSRSKPNQAPLAPLTSKSLTPEQGPLAPPPGPARPSEAKRAQPRRPTRSAKGRDGQEL